MKESFAAEYHVSTSLVKRYGSSTPSFSWVEIKRRFERPLPQQEPAKYRCSYRQLRIGTFSMGLLILSQTVGAFHLCGTRRVCQAQRVYRQSGIIFACDCIKRNVDGNIFMWYSRHVRAGGRIGRRALIITHHGT